MAALENPPPPETVQMAAILVATVPILIVYPFLQRHFAKGVMVGSIKG
jgi:putative aldouronate transport system permease protein